MTTIITTSETLTDSNDSIVIDGSSLTDTINGNNDTITQAAGITNDNLTVNGTSDTSARLIAP
jgi:hypothetical protein